MIMTVVKAGSPVPAVLYEWTRRPKRCGSAAPRCMSSSAQGGSGPSSLVGAGWSPVAALAEYVASLRDDRMTRRAQGEGGLHWDERRERWIATVTVGYDGRGKRMVRVRHLVEPRLRRRPNSVNLSGTAMTSLGGNGYTVRDAVEDWLGVRIGPSGLKHGRVSIGTCATSTSFAPGRNANFAT